MNTICVERLSRRIRVASLKREARLKKHVARFNETLKVGAYQ